MNPLRARSTADPAPASPLPDGHDDPGSPTYVPAAIREHYAAEPGDEAAATVGRRSVLHQQRLDAWVAAEQAAATAEQERDPAFVRRYREFGPPGVIIPLSAFPASVADASPTAAETARAVHVYRYARAARAHDAATAAADAHAAALVRYSCVVCGLFDPVTVQPVDVARPPLRTQVSRVELADPVTVLATTTATCCPACAATLGQVIAQAVASTVLPDGRTRDAAARAWVAAHRGG